MKYLAGSETISNRRRRSVFNLCSPFIGSCTANKLVRLASLAIMALTLACLSGMTAQAATFQVTNTNDSGAGSLRQAILSANANPGTDI